VAYAAGMNLSTARSIFRLALVLAVASCGGTQSGGPAAPAGGACPQGTVMCTTVVGGVMNEDGTSNDSSACLPPPCPEPGYAPSAAPMGP